MTAVKYKQKNALRSLVCLAAALIFLNLDKFALEQPTAFMINVHRAASLNLGNGTCEYENPLSPEEIPADVNFTNTIVVGYPGGHKRMVAKQMEALTKLSTRDEWDYEYLGMTTQPFIKANYPHHEGLWGWQDHGDRVVLVVSNLRRTIDEYHDILSDIDYAKTWQEATAKMHHLYKAPVDEGMMVEWRDERVMDEIGWYGWLIDYWMEGGLMRDYFEHKITTKEHWDMLMKPETYTWGELQYDIVIGPDADVTPTYDPHCEDEVSQGCEAVLVLSADRLVDPVLGYEENRKIALYLNETEGVKDYLIEEETWDCIWDEMIVHKKGYEDYRARTGTGERKHPVSTRMLTKMVTELDRLITKYNGTEWNNKTTANYLVEILTEQRAIIQVELDETPDAVWDHHPREHWFTVLNLTRPFE